jgi:hypothetical protein
MSINWMADLRTYRTVNPEEYAWEKEQERVRQLEVFGPERIAEDYAHPASPAQSEELMWQIEELCSGPYGNISRGRESRTLPRTDLKGKRNPFHLTWNPSGLYGGFGASIVDGAPAHIYNFAEGGRVHKYGEELYVSQFSGRAIIRRWDWSTMNSNWHRDAEKPANALEIARTSKLLEKLDAADHANCSQAPKLPTFLEIGYGLDPAAVRGRRLFRNRAYLGVDRAIGAYEVGQSTYPDAVRGNAARFTESTDRNRNGAHIYFTLGGGDRLPVKNDSVDEVFMSNVLNAPLEPGKPDEILNAAHWYCASTGTKTSGPTSACWISSKRMAFITSVPSIQK